MDKTRNLSIAYKIGLAAIALLGIIALIVYKERTLFVDSSWFLFHLLNEKSFYFMEMRFGAFVTQVGVLAAVKCGLSLKGIMMLFSLSFYVFYFVAALVIGFRWQQKQLAILLSFYLVLFISDGFFCTVGEIFQGLTWMFLFFALYFQKLSRHNIWSALRLGAFAFLALICHLIVLFPFAFLWLYLNLEYKSLKELIRDKKFWTYSLVLLSLGFLRYYVSNLGWYDATKLQSVHEISLSSFLSAFQSGQAKTFLTLLWQNYWVALVLFLLGMVLLIKDKKYWQLSLVVVFTLFYFAMVCVVYPNGYGRDMLFYYENEWAPLSVILSTPFVFQIFKTAIKPKLIGLLCSFVFLARFCYIYESCRYYNQRLENLSLITDKLYEDKAYKAILIAEEQQAKDYLVMAWSTPIESMMLSKVKGYEPAVSFKIAPRGFAFRQLTDSFYSNFNITENSYLDYNYYALDTIGDYNLIENIAPFNLKKLD